MRLALIDVETTGCKPPEDRIIDIGIVLVDDNEIVEEWESLVNPECSINPFISKLTGISDIHVNAAPKFLDIHEKVNELLSGRLFVAHNASFDYSFVKHEFNRIHVPFQATRLCTVKLSRYLYPKERRHNLDAIIERMSLTIENRHRALPDAKIIYSFIQSWRSSHGIDLVNKKMKEISKKPALPPKLPSTLIDNLSTSVGVYIFYNQMGAPLYIGKSINIKERVLAHFYSDTQNAKELHINKELQHIEYKECAGELDALLLESKLIKEVKPIYNKRLRFTGKMWIAKKKKDRRGYFTLNIEETEILTYEDHENVELIARSKRQLQKQLTDTCLQYNLCPKLCGIEKGTDSCFAYQLEKCTGACIGKESPQHYNLRLLTAFTTSAIADWPFDEPIVIREHNQDLDMDAYHLVNNWSVYTTSKIVNDILDLPIKETLPIKLDEYYIIKNYLTKHSHDPSIQLRSKYYSNIVEQ